MGGSQASPGPQGWLWGSPALCSGPDLIPTERHCLSLGLYFPVPCSVAVSSSLLSFGAPSLLAKKQSPRLEAAGLPELKPMADRDGSAPKNQTLNMGGRKVAAHAGLGLGGPSGCGGWLLPGDHSQAGIASRSSCLNREQRVKAEIQSFSPHLPHPLQPRLPSLRPSAPPRDRHRAALVRPSSLGHALGSVCPSSGGPSYSPTIPARPGQGRADPGLPPRQEPSVCGEGGAWPWLPLDAEPWKPASAADWLGRGSRRRNWCQAS